MEDESIFLEPDPPREMRKFDTGATRSPETGKLDYEGFLSPWVLERYAEYMHEHRLQADGSLRASDNWQKGIPLSAYMKSEVRHTIEAWKVHREAVVPFGDEIIPTADGPITLEDCLCAKIFNTCGYLHELLRARRERKVQ